MLLKLRLNIHNYWNKPFNSSHLASLSCNVSMTTIIGLCELKVEYFVVNSCNLFPTPSGTDPWQQLSRHQSIDYHQQPRLPGKARTLDKYAWGHRTIHLRFEIHDCQEL